MTIDHIILLLILCITVSTLIVVSVKKSDEEYLHSSSDFLTETTISGYATFDSNEPFYTEKDQKGQPLLIPIGSTIKKIHLKIDFEDLKDTSPECYQYEIDGGESVNSGGAGPSFTEPLTYDQVSKGVTVDSVMTRPVDKYSTSVNWSAAGPLPDCSKYKGVPSGTLYVQVTYKPPRPPPSQ